MSYYFGVMGGLNGFLPLSRIGARYFRNWTLILNALFAVSVTARVGVVVLLLERAIEPYPIQRSATIFN